MMPIWHCCPAIASSICLNISLHTTWLTDPISYIHDIVLIIDSHGPMHCVDFQANVWLQSSKIHNTLPITRRLLASFRLASAST
jgi:hypothetical protein